MPQKVYNERNLDKMVDLYIKKNIEYCRLSKKLNSLSVKAFETRIMSKEFLKTNQQLNNVINELNACVAYFEIYHNNKITQQSA